MRPSPLFFGGRIKQLITPRLKFLAEINQKVHNQNSEKVSSLILKKGGGRMLGAIQREELRKAFSIPERYEILLVLALGKPAEQVVAEDG